MADEARWKEWINGPLGYSLQGATFGGALGWLYDKIQKKKNKGGDALKRMATGALLGSLSGAALHNYRSASKVDASSLLDILDDIQKERKVNADKEPK